MVEDLRKSDGIVDDVNDNTSEESFHFDINDNQNVNVRNSTLRLFFYFIITCIFKGMDIQKGGHFHHF